jgi:hypothetical protein
MPERETPYARVYSYVRAYEDEAWGYASASAWAQLDMLAAEYQRGERDWPETQKLLDEMVAYVTST